MDTGLKTGLWSVGFFSFFLVTACDSNPPKVKAAFRRVDPPREKPVAVLLQPPPPVDAEYDSSALAMLEAPTYEFQIFGAFPLYSDDSSASLLTVKKGNQLVVLDIAVQNTSAFRTVDIGQILLRAKVTDEEGTVYPRNALAVRTYELEYPDPNHRRQYNAMRGKLRPGEYCRATAYGFEAPADRKNFILTLDESGSCLARFKVRAAHFALD